MTKAFVLTAVKYSRLMIRPMLRMACFLDEDVVEGRLEQFETIDARTSLQGGLQDFLRVGTRLQLRLDPAAEPVDAGDARMGEKRVRAAEFNAHRVLAIRLLDRA